MKKNLFIILVIILSIIKANAQSYIKPIGYVSDFAKMLNESEDSIISSKIILLEKSTSIEIAVVTIPSLEGIEVREYAINLAEAWKVGKHNKNNGVMFLIAPRERRVSIIVGDGLSNILTSSKIEDIIQNVILPRFKVEDYSGGIIDGVDAIISTFKGTLESKDPINEQKAVNYMSVLKTVMIFVSSVLFILIIIFFTEKKENKESFFLKRNNITELFEKVQLISFNSDIKKWTLKKANKKIYSLKENFSDFMLLDKNKLHKLNWAELNKKINVIEYELNSLIYKMEKQIKIAETARVEGPKLLNNIPNVINKIEDQIKSFQDEKVMESLSEAKELYKKAKQQSLMDVIDWVILFSLLNRCNEHLNNAENYLNPEDKNEESFSSNKGFGHNSGFGGGGGFRTGSSGSGKW